MMRVQIGVSSQHDKALASSCLKAAISIDILFSRYWVSHLIPLTIIIYQHDTESITLKLFYDCKL